MKNSIRNPNPHYLYVSLFSNPYLSGSHLLTVFRVNLLMLALILISFVKTKHPYLIHGFPLHVNSLLIFDFLEELKPLSPPINLKNCYLDIRRKWRTPLAPYLLLQLSKNLPNISSLSSQPSLCTIHKCSTLNSFLFLTCNWWNYICDCTCNISSPSILGLYMDNPKWNMKCHVQSS